MHQLYEDVTQLLRETADICVMPYFRKLSAEQIERKADTPGCLEDLVTIADREAEAMLIERLSKMLPGAAIVGEESCEADPSLKNKLGDELCWIIDPVDGTNNFGAGEAPFGIMVALAQSGEATAGWILDPLSGRICHAVRGGGAFINENQIFARESGEDKPIAAISTIFVDPDRRADLESRIYPRFYVTDIPRCAAEQYPRLALGINDISLFERTLAWDHAAGALFINEAGGKVARPDGRPYRVDTDEIGMLGAASPRIWEEAARILFD